MRRKRVLIQTLLALVLLWGAVTVVRAFAGSKQITAGKIAAEANAAGFEDWSQYGTAPDTSRGKDREKKIREVADLVNRLDFAEREKTRDDRSLERMTNLMTHDEKVLFIDLTVRESMGRFMEAIDKLPPEKRKQFVEKALKDIETGKTAEEIARLQNMGKDVMEKVQSEGMRAYFEKASADTKLDLAPLMESTNELMQNLRGQEIGPGSR